MSSSGNAAEKLAVFRIPGAPTLLVSFSDLRVLDLE